MKKVNITMCSEKDTDYFAILDVADDLKLFENNTLRYVLNAKEDDIVSAVYKCDTLVYTKTGENSLCVKVLDSTLEIEKITFEEYDQVQVLKYINDISGVVVFRGFAAKKEQIVIYDLVGRTIVCTLPIAGIFYDLYMNKDWTNIIVLCNHTEENYEMDISDSVYLVHFKRVENQLKVVDAIVFEDNVEYYEKGDRMKFPLYSYWTYGWPSNESISSSGEYILYYCNEMRGLVLSHFKNGNVYKMFTLPDTCKSYDKYYFNDGTNVLSVINADGEIEQFYVHETEENTEIDLLNSMYNETYIKGAYLQNRFDFNRVFYRIIENTVCEKKE